MSRVLVGGVVVALVGCGPLGPTPRPKDLRVVKARLIPPSSQTEALGGTRSVQLAAASVEGGQLKELHVGDAVDPRTVQTISVGVPKGQSVNLFVQTPKGNAAAFGQLVAVIEWSDGHGGVTSRLPAGNENSPDIDLGELNWVTGSASTLADNRLPVDDAHNPLDTSDRDGDAASDLTDTDDDSDGTDDATDVDADGDGFADQDQALRSLPDRNGQEDQDGVPDELE
ncbi:MAG: hypothetical protein AB2A00_28465 [Myxococcota bacterium]